MGPLSTGSKAAILGCIVLQLAMLSSSERVFGVHRLLQYDKAKTALGSRRASINLPATVDANADLSKRVLIIKHDDVTDELITRMTSPTHRLGGVVVVLPDDMASVGEDEIERWKGFEAHALTRTRVRAHAHKHKHTKLAREHKCARLRTRARTRARTRRVRARIADARIPVGAASERGDQLRRVLRLRQRPAPRAAGVCCNRWHGVALGCTSRGAPCCNAWYCLRCNVSRCVATCCDVSALCSTSSARVSTGTTSRYIRTVTVSRARARTHTHTRARERTNERGTRARARTHAGASYGTQGYSGRSRVLTGTHADPRR
jgi:hypothetical protein